MRAVKAVKRGGARPLGGVLAGLVDRLGLKGHIDECRAVEQWPAAAGPRVAARTAAVAVRDGTLLVAVPSGAWARELAFLKPVLLDAVNRLVGRAVITDIRFSPAHWRRAARAQDAAGAREAAGDPAAGRHAQQAAHPTTPQGALRAEFRAEVEGRLAAVADPDLRRRFLAFVQAAERLPGAGRAPGAVGGRGRTTGQGKEGDGQCSSTSGLTR